MILIDENALAIQMALPSAQHIGSHSLSLDNNQFTVSLKLR
jgi:hypothetical protein